MVVEADDTGDLPSSTLVFLPEMNELGLANWLCIVLSGVVEAVHTNFYRAIVGNSIDLKCPWNEFSDHFPADVVPDAFNRSLPGTAEAAYVMIKLQIVRQKRAKFLEIAAVVSIEKLRIQRLDCLKQWVRCSSGLCVDGRKRSSNQSCKKQGLERSKARFHAGILSTGIRTWFYARVEWIVPPLAGETSPRLQHVAADRDSPCGHFLWVGFAFDQSSVAVPQFRYPQKQFVESSGYRRLLGRGLKPTLLTSAVSQTDPSHLATTLLNPIFMNCDAPAAHEV